MSFKWLTFNINFTNSFGNSIVLSSRIILKKTKCIHHSDVHMHHYFEFFPSDVSTFFLKKNENMYFLWKFNKCDLDIQSWNELVKSLKEEVEIFLFILMNLADLG